MVVCKYWSRQEAAVAWHLNARMRRFCPDWHFIVRILATRFSN